MRFLDAFILRLDGPNGSLDLCTVYMRTGLNRHARDHVRAQLAQSLRPSSQALTVIAEDFNYVSEVEDRYSIVDGSWSGSGDTVEEQSWHTTVADLFNLREVFQSDYRHSSALGSSKLDRAYSNHHLADQQDHHFGCSALEWVLTLSAHRAISFFCTPPVGHASPSSQAWQPSVIGHQSWPKRVGLRLLELDSEDKTNVCPLRRLLLSKRAMKEVGEAMAKESCHCAPTAAHDRLGLTMRYLRAVEHERLGAMQHCAKAYPALADFRDPSNPLLRCTPALEAI